MNVTCLNCNNDFKSHFEFDELGWHVACPRCGSSFDVADTILLDDLETWEDIIDAFNTLKVQAKRIGMPICLNVETSTDLELYFHDDYPNRILVDKHISNLKKKCRRCGKHVDPSDVAFYPYVCRGCDENMYEFEVCDE